MAKPDRNRDLALIRETGSTARVLNLAMTYERAGETEEHQNRPLFRNKRLNRCVILKHTIRPAERALFGRPRMTATKIVVPFAYNDLSLGGVVIMVDQLDFERVLRQTLGGYDQGDAFSTDVEVLRLLDSIPSFDPFLMRERLRHSGVEPARCYFDVSEADIERMRAFVGAEIAQLVGLAYANGGAAARDLSSKLADKLMTDETANALDALRETLRMTGDDYREGVFAWKGFLYYKWMMSEFTPKLIELKRSILSARIVRASDEDKILLNDMKQRIVRQLDIASAQIQKALEGYGVAFAALSSGQAATFRDFLLRAPALFIPIGDAVGVVKHIESFWRFRFPAKALIQMEADEAVETFQDFDVTLDALDLVRSAQAETQAA